MDHDRATQKELKDNIPSHPKRMTWSTMFSRCWTPCHWHLCASLQTNHSASWMATSRVWMGNRLHGLQKNMGGTESFQRQLWRRLSWNWLIRTPVMYSRPLQAYILFVFWAKILALSHGHMTLMSMDEAYLNSWWNGSLWTPLIALPWFVRKWCCGLISSQVLMKLWIQGTLVSGTHATHSWKWFNSMLDQKWRLLR